MSDNASWYQRRMSQLRGQPQQQQPQQPPQYNQPYSHPQQPQYPQYPQQYPQQPQQQQVLPPQPQQPPQVTVENLWGAMQFWKGGPAHRIDTQPCPSCGSPQYYSRQVGKRGPPPAPHCYNCGYNDGLFVQGDEANWIAASG